jgi:hypothetical protein
MERKDCWLWVNIALLSASAAQGEVSEIEIMTVFVVDEPRSRSSSPNRQGRLSTTAKIHKIEALHSAGG